MRCTVIGITGAARSGKDTVGRQIVTKLQHEGAEVYRYALADPLRPACATLFNVPEERFHGDYDREEIDPFWEISYREMLQKVGTECMRWVFRDDFWITRLEKQIADDGNDREGVYVIVTDIRFDNEAQWIADHGGAVVKVIRPGVSPLKGAHASEDGVSTDLIDYGIDNDGDLDDLWWASVQLVTNIRWRVKDVVDQN